MAAIGRDRPAMSRALLQMLASLRETLTPRVLAALQASGSIDETLNGVLPLARLQQAGNAARVQLLLTLMAGGAFTLRRVPSRAALTFNVLDPLVAPALYEIDRLLIGSVQQNVVAIVRNAIVQAIQTGTAVDVRALVGLTVRQVGEVQRFATRQQQARAVAAYTQRRVALNTEQLAHTAVLRAFKAGQQLAIGQAVSAGIFFGPLVKTWVNMGDEKVRDAHQNGQLGGQTVAWDRPYSNGDMVPGESTWRCRCVSHFSLSPRL